jgi:Protein of unknown function (DUF3014)
MTWKITLAVACLLAGAAVFFLLPESQPEIPPEATDIQPPAPPPDAQPIVRVPDVEPSEPEQLEAADAEQIPAEELDPLIAPPEGLDGSDSLVQKVIAEIAPTLSTWLIPEQQVRKWVLAVDLLANGELPKKYPPLNFPMTPFKVKKNDQQFETDKANYSRAQPLINAITGIDPKLVARYYEHWLPTLEAAYAEQGKPGSFDRRFRIAIEQVLSVESLSKNEPLSQPHVFYQYADTNREKRSELDKLMWRLGAANMKRVQEYLQQLQAHL